jgi:glycerophosphoryl diester phosphodiesterase
MMKIVGHRGARNLAPENTLAGIQKALEHQVDEIEIDVRVTSDGQVVLQHNQFLRDQAGNWLNIRNCTYEQLRQHKADLCTLSEAIRVLDKRVPLQIEVKWGEQTQPVVDVLQSFLAQKWQATDFLVGSKKQQTLLDIHRALPDIPKVVIEPFSSLRGVWRAKQLGSNRLSMNHLWLWGGFLRAMQRRGYSVYAYTINNPARAKRWQHSGLAGVITDDPERFR